VDESVAVVALFFAVREASGDSVVVGVFAGAGAFTASFTAGDEGGSSAGWPDVISRGSEAAGFEPCALSVGSGVLLAGSGGAAAASNVSSALPDKFAEKVDFLGDRGFSLSRGTKGSGIEVALPSEVLTPEAPLLGLSANCSVALSPCSLSSGAAFPDVFSSTVRAGGSGAAPWLLPGTFKLGAASFEAF
jgi:hypothetical protein